MIFVIIAIINKLGKLIGHHQYICLRNMLLHIVFHQTHDRSNIKVKRIPYRASILFYVKTFRPSAVSIQIAIELVVC